MAKTSSKPKSVRAQKQEATRHKLLTAAAQLVGLHGYAGASIHKVTTLGDIANGTFYNYFKSQQDLFDQLLPSLGEDLIQLIRESIKGERDSIRREELGFRAFFDYLAKNPSFYRVLNEADTFAPKAYHDHMQNMVDGYIRALKHAHSKGELSSYSEREFEVIVYILLSARNYLSYKYCVSNGGGGRLPDWVTRAYMKFVEGGVTYGSRDGVAGADRDRPPDAEVEVYSIRSLGEGWVDMSMRVLDQHLDTYGCVDRGAITGLIDRSATEAMAPTSDGAVQVVSLSTSFIRPSHARTLVAKGSCTAVAGSLAHASVEIREHGEDGALIATGLVIFASDRQFSSPGGAH